jgi:alkylhydroperoxidase family enzyme
MTPTPGVVPPETYHTLEQHWSPAQIVEITSVIGNFNFFNRFANALDIPPTK